MFGWLTQLKKRILQKISFKALPICLCLLLVIQSVYSQEKVEDELRKKVEEAAAGLDVPAPDPFSPVSVKAGTVWSDDKKQLALIMKVEVLENWHIYALVPPDQPYIQSELRLLPPDGLTPLEKWETPVPYAYGDGIFVYKGSLLFIHYFSVKKTVDNKTLEAGLYYQTCDFNQCLPPELEMIKLAL